MCITKPMLVLGIGEDPLNRFLAHGIHFAAVSQANLFSQIEEVLPDMCGQRSLAILFGSAGLPARTIAADIRLAAVRPPSVLAGGRMPQQLALRAKETVLLFVTGKILGTENAFFPFIASIGKKRNPAIFQCLFCNPMQTAARGNP